MLNSADFISPNGFNAYNFAHQPGTSTAMAASALAVAAYSLDTNNLMQNSMRANGGFRTDMSRPSNKRERTKFDEKQLGYMEHFFSSKPYPDGNDRELMAKQLGLTEVKVQIWFKNRRAKDRNQKHLQQLIHKNIPSGDLKRCSGNDSSLTLDSNDSSNGARIGDKKIKMDPTSSSASSSSPPEPILQKDQLGVLNGSIKNEILDAHSLTAESYFPLASTAHNDIPWDDKDSIKQFAANNYNFNFDPSTPFNGSTTNPEAALLNSQNGVNPANLATWMQPPYNPYPFGYFPTTYNYGHATVSPATMNQMTGYPDLYSSQYGQMSSLKESKF